MSSSKSSKWFAAFVAFLLAVGGFMAFGASAASATDESWTPKTNVVYGPIYDDPSYDCELPGNGKGDDLSFVGRASGTQAAGEQIVAIKVDGSAIPADVSMYFRTGTHSYTYTVENLNSTTDPKETADISGSFVIKRCDEAPTVAPKVTASLEGGLLENKPVVKYNLTFDPGTSKEGSWTIVVEDFNGTVYSETVQGAANLTGSFPYECGSKAFYVTVTGQEGTSDPVTVEIPCPVDNGGGTGGGDTGGNTDGGTTTPPSTGGVDTGTTGGTNGTTDTNTTVKAVSVPEVPDRNQVSAGATGDVVISATPLYIGGGLVLAAAIVLIVRRKLVNAR